jgi:hypothetical protein
VTSYHTTLDFSYYAYYDKSVTDSTFEGIPLDELPIRAVDWVHRAEHIRSRSARYPRDFDVEPAWATERRSIRRDLLISRARARSSCSVTASRQTACSRFWLVPKDDMPTSGEWWDASACAANDVNIKNYNAETEG